MTMADSTLDPRLRLQPPTQPPRDASSLSTISTRTEGGTPDAQSDGENDGGGTSRKRQKLNLYKCNQCRVARKKCFPADRVWPNKCDRCKIHKPELPCTEPQLNTRKRGPNLQKTNEPSKIRESSADTAPTPSRERDVVDDAKDVSTSQQLQPIGIPKRIKRERDQTMEPVSTTPQAKPVGAQQDQSLAAVYLDLGPTDFRLALLKPGKKEERIRCSFKTVSIKQPPEYQAMTYFWGGNDHGLKDSVKIELEDVDGGKHDLYIRTNLCNALKSLRDPTDVKSFWVDALCINRSNKSESNDQTLMKFLIFHNAQNQCFWLGDDVVFKRGLDFIKKILDPSMFLMDSLVRDSTSIDGWSAFVALLKNVAFRRLWMVQEVTVAKWTSLHCGSQKILYTDFVAAVGMFFSCRDNLVRLFRENGKDYKELLDRNIAVAKGFIDVTQNTLRKPDQLEARIERRLDLETLVSQLTELTCTNPLDRIYSVLALAKDGSRPEETLMDNSPARETAISLQIDYGRKVEDVYSKFVLHCIKYSQSLDIICRRWASAVPEKDVKLPTWIRPIQTPLQLQANPKSTERINADSLVGLPNEKCYLASANKHAEWREGLDPLSLEVKGFVVDKIAQLGPRASEGIIQYEWLELGGCELSEHGDKIPERFWRTLVGDRGPHCANAPSWYHRAFLYCLSHSTGASDLNTDKLIAAYEVDSSLVVDFLRRVQAVIWNRRFLYCENDKNDTWVGLAPEAAKTGDVVTILYGCSVPVLLRPMGKTEDGSVAWWHVVGECYVHGIMDGELVKDKDDPQKDKWFELR